jgi:hypothetical protein
MILIFRLHLSSLEPVADTDSLLNLQPIVARRFSLIVLGAFVGCSFAHGQFEKNIINQFARTKSTVAYLCEML